MKKEYTIKDLEELSGIKAHTIRIWEKRYSLFVPKRTETNIRYYDDEDVKKILDVSLLQQKGMKISKISKLDPVEMRQAVAQYYEETLESPIEHAPKIQQMIKEMLDMNEQGFEKLFSTAVLKLGLEETMRHVIFPFMQRVGMLWNIGEIDPGQEHFVSNLVKQKMFSAIDGIVIPRPHEDEFLLYLMEGELHELSLLFAAYLLKRAGYNTIYLGQSVPLLSIKATLERRNITSLLTIITTSRPANHYQKHLNQIDKLLGKRKLYLAASDESIKALTLSPRMSHIGSLDTFVSKLT